MESGCIDSEALVVKSLRPASDMLTVGGLKVICLLVDACGVV